MLLPPVLLPLELGAELEPPLAPVALEPLLPCWLMHCCSSAPVIPAHWLGVAPAADEPPPEALLPEALSLGDELLGEVVLGDELPPAALPPADGVEPVVASELPPLLVLPLLIPAPEPDDPALPAALPPEDCAHDAVPKPIKAAVTAALIALTIMVRFL